MRMKYKGVGFDLDGTLAMTHVDYGELANVNQYVLGPLGFPVKEMWEGHEWVSRDPLYDYLRENGRMSEKDELDAYMDKRCLEIEIQGGLDAVICSGIKDTLSKLKSKGVKLGVVTRGGHEYAMSILSANDMLQYFDVIQGRDDYPYTEIKPSPMAMVHLADDMGISTDDLLYVGDSPTDYMSARDAGVDYAGVLTGKGTTEGWRSLGDDITIINSAADVIDLV